MSQMIFQMYFKLTILRAITCSCHILRCVLSIQ